MRKLRVVLLIGLLFSAAPALVLAQGQTGTVSGVVTDQTDAVIPGAKVTLTNVLTGIRREGNANEQGYFLFDRVAPGEYTLGITAEGFKKLEITSLDVRVAKNTDVGSRKLEVGAVADTVQVEAGTAPLIETQSAQITSSLSAKQIQTLRQGFGGIDSAAILTPGVIPGMGNINSNGMQVAANGQRSRSTQFMLDGHQMNDITIGGPSFFFANYDQVAEYQVITNQFSAEYGRNLGATVNILTKGGTNDIHGSVFWQHENDNLNSVSSFESRDGLDNPESKTNQGGFTVGGPVLKDRLFYYGAFRYSKTPGANLSIGTSSAKVITPNGLDTLRPTFGGQNSFQYYEAFGPFARPDGDPVCAAGTTDLSGSGNPGVPATIAGMTGVEFCSVQRLIPDETTEKDYSIRMDWTQGKHSLTGHWEFARNTFCCSGGQNGFFIDIPDEEKQFRVTYTTQLTARQTNTFRFSWGRFGVSFEGGNTESISNVQGNATRLNLPAGWLDIGLATNLPQNRFLDTFQYSNTWSYMVGRHFFKAGVEFHRNLTTLFFLPFINGQYNFSGTDLTTFFSNQPASVQFAAGPGSFDPKEFDQFYFFQDDWRILPNLTLNLGLRYEHNGQPINRAVDEILARESDPSTAFWLQTVPIEDRTLPRIPNDNNNWAPRIGFAWNPQWNNWFAGNSQLTVRGGYGVAYELAFYNILLNMTTAAPRVFLFTNSGAAATPMPAGGTGSDVAGTIPVPLNTIDPRTLAQTRLSSDFHNPYGQNWSLGIQREFGHTSVFELRYVGTNGIGLFQSRDANPVFTSQLASFPNTVQSSPLFPNITPCPAGNIGTGRPDCNRSNVRERINSARSNYHSMQVRYEMRNWMNQLTSTVGYTWSKGIDNVSEIFGFFGDGSVAFAQNPFDIIRGERGVSNQNLRQTLALSYIWELPWFRSQQGFLGRALGGWSISGVTTLLTGRPYTPVQFDSAGNASCTEKSGFASGFAGLLSTCRPFAGNPSAPAGNVGIFDSLGNLTLVSTSAPTTLNDVRFIVNDGNAMTFLNPSSPFGVGRNPAGLEGDGTVDFDIAIDKSFKMTERIALQFRAAMNNAFNHRNYGVPNIFADETTFGVKEENDVGGRVVRLQLKVVF
jgi:hypothetical protein